MEGYNQAVETLLNTMGEGRALIWSTRIQPSSFEADGGLAEAMKSLEHKDGKGKLGQEVNDEDSLEKEETSKEIKFEDHPCAQNKPKLGLQFSICLCRSKGFS